jgi:hypothetical protein
MAMTKLTSTTKDRKKKTHKLHLKQKPGQQHPQLSNRPQQSQLK